MANDFGKQIEVAFDEIMIGMDDELVLSQKVKKYETGSTTMERSNDQIWRPQPYIAVSNDGADQTGNFGDNVQMLVPAQLGTRKAVTWFQLSLLAHPLF